MIKWGVIGLGNIAHRFVESLAHFDDATFYAGASRNINKQKEFEEKYHPTVIYDNYDALLNDECVDVIYIALPHALHYQWAKKALEKGKAVFVEKPAVLTSKEIIELTNISKDKHVFFMEAMKTRFISLTKKIHEIVDSKELGELISIENAFTFEMPYDENLYHFDPIQGGALYDTGIYNIATVLDYLRDDIINIDVESRICHQVDTYVKTTLTFNHHQKAIMVNSMDCPTDRKMTMTFTEGSIECTPFYRPEKIIIHDQKGERSIEEQLQYDDFYPEIEAVHYCLNHHLYQHPLYCHQDMINCIMLLENIKKKID